jgi:hypothetical protein
MLFEKQISQEIDMLAEHLLFFLSRKEGVESDMALYKNSRHIVVSAHNATM